MRFVLWSLVGFTLAAQTPDVYNVGHEVTAPRLVHKVEPEYSALARADHVQGTVLYQLVVDERGLPTDIKIISPLGFGLDENGEKAIGKWRFKPGEKNGQPVKVRATVEVNFRFPTIWFDEKSEKRRTSYNSALENMKRSDPKVHDAAVKTIQDSAAQDYVPALYVLGLWKTSGENVDQNQAEGWMLIQKAADKNYGSALYSIAQRQLEGNALPGEVEKALDTMRRAAVLGSVQAQYSLGHKYGKGVGVQPDTDRARRYFRLCATRGVPQCQTRLAHLMLLQPGIAEYDYEQAIAWLQLAAEQGLPDALKAVSLELAKLSPQQLKAVNTWKTRLKPNP